MQLDSAGFFFSPAILPCLLSFSSRNRVHMCDTVYVIDGTELFCKFFNFFKVILPITQKSKRRRTVETSSLPEFSRSKPPLHRSGKVHMIRQYPGSISVSRSILWTGCEYDKLNRCYPSLCFIVRRISIFRDADAKPGKHVFISSYRHISHINIYRQA